MAGFSGGSAVFMKLKVTPEAFIATSLAKVLFEATIRFVIIILPCLVIFKLFAGWHLLLFPVGLLATILFGTARNHQLVNDSLEFWHLREFFSDWCQIDK